MGGGDNEEKIMVDEEDEDKDDKDDMSKKMNN